MPFYVTFIVKRGSIKQSNVEISYLYNGSKKNLTSDKTNKNGEVRTRWENNWRDKDIEVFFDGYNKRTITLIPNDTHNINLPSGCFPYKTEILTPTGVRYIGDIKDGDLVCSFNSINGYLVERRVIKKIEHQDSPIVELKIVNGKSLFVTTSHRLLTINGYTTVEKLNNGDSLSLYDNNIYCSVVEKIVETNHFEPVYNLIVEDEFNFVANGFIVHCFTTFPKLQTCFWRGYEKMNKRMQNLLLDVIDGYICIK